MAGLPKSNSTIRKAVRLFLDMLPKMSSKRMEEMHGKNRTHINRKGKSTMCGYRLLPFLIFSVGILLAPANHACNSNLKVIPQIRSRSIEDIGCDSTEREHLTFSFNDLPKETIVDLAEDVSSFGHTDRSETKSECSSGGRHPRRSSGTKSFGSDIQGTSDNQQLFVDETSLRLPGIVDFTTDVELADVDNDGDLDLCVSNTEGQQNRLFINTGTGIFFDETALRLPADSDFSLGVECGDVDDDGDLDLFVTNNFAIQYPGCHLLSGQNRLLINTGEGIFVDETDSRLPESIAASTDAAFFDADGDDDIDIVVTNSLRPGECLFLGGGQLELLINNGRGVFTDETSDRLPNELHTDVSLDVGDIDEDGDIDLVVVDPYDRSRILSNDGSGVFVDQSDERFAVSSGSTREVILFDADSDGDLDLFCANDSSSVRTNRIGAQNRLMINDGSGVFLDETEARLPLLQDVSLGGADVGDLDGDGNLDVLVANNWLMSEGRQNYLLLNGGSGYFGYDYAYGLPELRDVTTDVTLGDVNGDGLLDAVVANYGEQNRILIGQREPRGGPADPEVLVGDVSMDGQINIMDVLTVVNHTLGHISLDQEGQYRADCNGDGLVNIMDVIGIVNAILDIGECGSGGCKALVTPEVLTFIRSLEAYLSEKDFSILLTLVSTESSSPLEYRLSQNYPNPFNPETSIAYTLPEVSRVKIIIYNALGRVVDVLFDGDQGAGQHTVTWTVRDISSGVYFCRIWARGLSQESGSAFTATRRMVFVK
jgi:hypothetical protein